MTEQITKNFRWRLDFKSPLELLLNIQTLFRSVELTKLVIATNTSKEDLKASTGSVARFWLAATLFIPKRQTDEEKFTNSKGLSSICIEIDSPIDTSEFKLSQRTVQELRKLGWLRYKERKNEIFTPLYSWQQFISEQSLKPSLNNQNIWSCSDRQTIDVQCKFIGSQQQCSAALTHALKIAQTTPIEWTQAYQVKTLIPTGIINSLLCDYNSSVFSFVFMNIDHYFLDWLETQNGFMIDLVFPSLRTSTVDLEHLAKTQADLYNNIWSTSKLNRLSKVSSIRDLSTVITWSEVSTQANLKWFIEDSQTYNLPSIESYLPKLDAILVSSELVTEIRSFFSSLSSLYAEMYSLALVEVNHQNYYLITLARKPIFNPKDRKQHTSYTPWNEEHLKLFREFISEVKHGGLGQIFFFQCISKEPLFYLGLESKLVPQLKPFEILKLLRIEKTDQSEKKLALLSPFIGKAQEKDEAFCFQMPKPKFYRHEEFALLLYPQRFNRIKQWFDESFICLSPQAFDDES